MEESSGCRLSAECLDEPPNSRVFVVLSKDTGEALIRERFAPFGDIQNIWLLRDKRTNESRGIAFIKYARSSQACRAMEEMHGRSLAPDTKPIKVPRRPNPAGERDPGWATEAWQGAPFPAWRPRTAAGLGRSAQACCWNVVPAYMRQWEAPRRGAGCGDSGGGCLAEAILLVGHRQRAATEHVRPTSVVCSPRVMLVRCRRPSGSGAGRVRGLRAWRCSSGAAVRLTLECRSHAGRNLPQAWGNHSTRKLGVLFG